MLNQLTMKDYERRMEKFDFEELIMKESQADIAKAVIIKVKKNPMMSEFYVKVVLSTIRSAYMEIGRDQEFFALLMAHIIDTEGSLNRREAET